ncbi:MAG: hypothetical protein U0414_20525 [Polyangiaceae bacterium]
MGSWTVNTDEEPGILKLRLVGQLTEPEMRAFVAAHNAAIDAYKGKDYRVWVDLSELMPLSPECTELFQEAKLYSNAQRNFRGSAVLVMGAMVALQHRRTSVDAGVMPTELISSNPVELRAHLRRVHRRA